MIVLVIYLFIVNVVAFMLYGADKWRAIKGKWRIRERTLIGIAVIGGSAGALVGMYYFRHKTKHWQFKIGLPMILILQIALWYWVL